MKVQAGGNDLQVQVVISGDEIDQLTGTSRARAPCDIADDFVALPPVQIQ